MKIMKLLTIAFIIGSMNMIIVESALTDDITNIKSIDRLNSALIADIIQRVGFSTFGGIKIGNGKVGLDNLLSDNPMITKLTQQELETWNTLLMYIEFWIERARFQKNINSEFKKEYGFLHKASDQIKMYSEMLHDKPFIKSIFLSWIDFSLKSVAQVFFENYKKLFSQIKKFPHEFAQNSLEAYRKISGNKEFYLNDLLDTYVGYRPSDTRNESDQKSVIEALALSGVLDGDEDYATQQKKITPLINLLEEFIERTNRSQYKELWEKRALIAQRIVDDLYYFYPAALTYSHAVVPTFVKTKSSKAYLLLYETARVLMVTLRAYLRKAEFITEQ